MSVALEREWWISPDAYLEGEVLAETKHEYVGGIVYAMVGARNRHNQIAGNILGELYAALRGQGCQPFNSDTKVRIRNGDDVRFYYPDVMVAIVDSERLGVTCHRRAEEGGRWTTDIIVERTQNLPLPDIGCSLPIEALYARTGL